MTNTGDRFGRWTVLREGELYFAPSGRYKAKRFVCQCKCGKEKLFCYEVDVLTEDELKKYQIFDERAYE